ncbi:uncharacterized protein VP01_2204g4 [Puccinia sorghi]|uniref:DDE Tnp4 domain-containing protein n=1 Tax=Puccinia sorghi TaxID=27349 RepID=A0A0L6V9J0_9BASI|nr:uncharacterized protein VP01_2204g4 [Puccinia sorghi]
MYGLATLIVCNKEKQIIYYLTGWPGCRTLFSPGQYLLADSPTESNLRFNQYLASLRVCNKHCIGILKGRFQLLRGLRLELTSVKSMGRITQWVGACLILHKYILHDKPPSIFMADEDHSPSFIPDQLPCRGTNSAGNNLCEKVF